VEIAGAKMVSLVGNALIQNSASWDGQLYRPLSTSDSLIKEEIRLIPYFAWGNRGKSEMSVWIPLNKSEN
jgi:hypothetical protein